MALDMHFKIKINEKRTEETKRQSRGIRPECTTDTHTLLTRVETAADDKPKEAMAFNHPVKINIKTSDGCTMKIIIHLSGIHSKQHTRIYDIEKRPNKRKTY